MTSSALEVRLDGVTDVGTNVLQNRISRCVRLHVVAIVVIVAEQVLAGTLRDDDNGVSSTMHDLLDVMQCSIHLKGHLGSETEIHLAARHARIHSDVAALTSHELD